MANVTTYSAFTDAQSQNDISRNVRQYRDLDLFFFKKGISPFEIFLIPNEIKETFL